MIEVTSAPSSYFAAMLAWGFLGAGCLALMEKLIPVVPSYLLLVFLGMTRVSNASELMTIILMTTIGSTTGAMCWFVLGRTIGLTRSADLVARFGRYVFLSRTFFLGMADLYRRNDFCVSLFAQTIPVVRIYLPLAAGTVALDAQTFLVATLLGALAWNTPLLSLGYFLRHTQHDLFYVAFVAFAGLLATETLVLLTLRIGLGLTVITLGESRAQRQDPPIP